MTSVQLQLPFGQVDPIPTIHYDKLLEKSTSITAFVQQQKKQRNVSPFKVLELREASQDFDVVALAIEFSNDVDLNETVDILTIRESLIRCRADLTRKHVNAFIAYKNDKPIGFLVGVCTQAFHQIKVVAEQKLWYVSKTHRGSRAALMLIKAYENWARMNGATQLFTGTANLRYAEQTSQILEKLGYARVGALHVKEI